MSENNFGEAFTIKSYLFSGEVKRHNAEAKSLVRNVMRYNRLKWANGLFDETDIAREIFNDVIVLARNEAVLNQPFTQVEEMKLVFVRLIRKVVKRWLREGRAIQKTFDYPSREILEQAPDEKTSPSFLYAIPQKEEKLLEFNHLYYFIDYLEKIGKRTAAVVLESRVVDGLEKKDIKIKHEITEVQYNTAIKHISRTKNKFLAFYGIKH